MVSNSTPIQVLFSAPAIKFNSRVYSSNYNIKTPKRRIPNTETGHNRFRSRKPPKNPRDLIAHPPQQRKISLNFNELYVHLKTKQPKSQLSLKPKDKAVPKISHNRLRNSSKPKLTLSKPSTTLKIKQNVSSKPKFISKSKFALSAKQPGSNFSLVVNPSESKQQLFKNYEPTLKLKNIKSSAGSLAGETSDQDYFIVPSSIWTKLKEKLSSYTIESKQMDSRSRSNNNESKNVNPQQRTGRKNPKRPVSCTCPKNSDRKKEIFWVAEPEDDQNEIRNNPCFGDGYPDTYGRVLGPTPDETILAGLQTVIDMCSVAERNVRIKPSRASGNKDIIQWVENEYSSLEQDLKSNPSQASLDNIEQRKETLQEIEKLVKKKNKLDEEARQISNNKAASTSTTKLSSKKRYKSKTDTSEDATEEEEEEEEENEDKEAETREDCPRQLSKFISCSCSTMTSEDHSIPAEEKKTQYTQTSLKQSSITNQQPSATIESPLPTTTASDTDEVDNKSAISYTPASSSTKQTSKTDLCTQGMQTSESKMVAKSMQTSEVSEDDTSKSGLLSNKSVQAYDCLQLSTKSVQCDLLPISVEPCPGSTKSLQTTVKPQQSIKSIQTSATADQSVRCHIDKSIQTSLQAFLTSEPSKKPLEAPVEKQFSKSFQTSATPSTTSKSTQTSSPTLSSSTIKSLPTLEVQEPPIEPSDVACQCNIINTVSDAKSTKEDEIKDKPVEVYPKESSLQNSEKVCICSMFHLAAIQEGPKQHEDPSLQKAPCQASTPSSQEQASKNSRHETLNETKFICADSSETELTEKGMCYEKCYSKVSLLKSAVKPAKKPAGDQLVAKICENSTCCRITKIREKEIPKNVCGETHPDTGKLHLTTIKLPGRKKSRSLHKQKSKENYVNTQVCKATCTTNQTSSGDSIAAPVPHEVRYAMVRITKFEHYSTFEVLNSTTTRPRFIPATTETIFVVRNKTQQ